MPPRNARLSAINLFEKREIRARQRSAGLVRPGHRKSTEQTSATQRCTHAGSELTLHFCVNDNLPFGISREPSLWQRRIKRSFSRLLLVKPISKLSNQSIPTCLCQKPSEALNVCNVPFSLCRLQQHIGCNFFTQFFEDCKNTIQPTNARCVCNEVNRCNRQIRYLDIACLCFDFFSRG